MGIRSFVALAGVLAALTGVGAAAASAATPSLVGTWSATQPPAGKVTLTLRKQGAGYVGSFTQSGPPKRSTTVRVRVSAADGAVQITITFAKGFPQAPCSFAYGKLNCLLASGGVALSRP